MGNNGKTEYRSDPRNTRAAQANMELVDESEYEYLEINQGRFSGGSYGSLEFKDTIMRNCDLSNLKADKLSFVNVRFESCDLANLEVGELYLKRTDFIKCRMTGITANESVITETLFSSCQMKFSQFRMTKLKYTIFDNCVIGESDFYASEFNHVNFVGSDLAGAEMSKTRHFDTDLRTSEISGLVIGIESLKGVTVGHSQIPDLVWLLGVDIK